MEERRHGGGKCGWWVVEGGEDVEAEGGDNGLRRRGLQGKATSSCDSGERGLV